MSEIGFSRSNCMLGSHIQYTVGSTLSTCKDRVQKMSDLHVQNELRTSGLGTME